MNVSFHGRRRVAIRFLPVGVVAVEEPAQRPRVMRRPTIEPTTREGRTYTGTATKLIHASSSVSTGRPGITRASRSVTSTVPTRLAMICETASSTWTRIQSRSEPSSAGPRSHEPSGRVRSSRRSDGMGSGSTPRSVCENTTKVDATNRPLRRRSMHDHDHPDPRHDAPARPPVPPPAAGRPGAAHRVGGRLDRCRPRPPPARDHRADDGRRTDCRGRLPGRRGPRAVDGAGAVAAHRLHRRPARPRNEVGPRPVLVGGRRSSSSR